jgi:hypothetical protein
MDLGVSGLGLGLGLGSIVNDRFTGYERFLKKFSTP